MRDPTRGVDQIIAEAEKEGKFEDLPGKGKPLVIDMSPDAVVKSILKEANVSMAPVWITVASEIDRLLEQGEQLLESYAAEYALERAALQSGVGPAEIPAVEPTASLPEARWRGWLAALTRIVGEQPPAPAGVRAGEALVTFHRRWDLTLERYAALLHDSNRKLRRFNEIVPLANRQRLPVPVQERLEAFAERFPRPARSADGTVAFTRGCIPADLLSPLPDAEDMLTRKRDVLQAVALQRARQFGRKPPPIG